MEAFMDSTRNDDSDPLDETKETADDPKPLDPEDADEVGSGWTGGSGGPAPTIYGEDDEADEHGDRLARGPEEADG